jgi:hypothetical protein
MMAILAPMGRAAQIAKSWQAEADKREACDV